MNKSNSFKPQKSKDKILKNYFREAKLLTDTNESIDDKRK
jgi:hypothetical protein